MARRPTPSDVQNTEISPPPSATDETINASDSDGEDARDFDGPSRTVLMVRHRVTVAIGNVSVALNGGDIVQEPDRVAAWEHDTEHFEVLEVPLDFGPAELNEQHARAVEELRRHAARLGFELFPIGLVDRRRLRH